MAMTYKTRAKELYKRAKKGYIMRFTCARFIERTTFASRLGKRGAATRSTTELFKIYPAIFILNLAAACGRFKFKISRHCTLYANIMQMQPVFKILRDLLGSPASLISAYLS